MAREAASGHEWRWEPGHGAGVGAVGQILTLEIRPAPADWNIRPDGKEVCRLGELVVKIRVRWAAERGSLLRSGRYASGILRCGQVLLSPNVSIWGIWPFIQPVPASTY